MARVTVIFEDQIGGTVIQVSSDPHFPINSDEGKRVADLQAATPAQAAAFGAVMEVAGLALTWELFITDEPVLEP